MFSTSDGNVMLKQIQSTHVPDGREIDVKPLLQIIEDIFKRAVPSVNAISGLGTQPMVEALEDKTYQSSFLGMLEALAYLIDRISCEITCKCSGGGDAHATAMAILNMLTSYSWDAKMALALGAFAVTYGEFWLVAQSYTSNQLAKAVAILKQLPEILEHASMLKPQFDAIKNLIKAMVDISKCVFEFKQLPSRYITTDFDAISSANAHIPVAVYWTVRSISACAAQLTGLTLLGREHMVSTTEAWELSSLASKFGSIHSHSTVEALHNTRNLFEMVHIDNMRVLKALICQKDDLLPLVDGATERRVNLDVLRRKNVLLLISDLDILQEELSILEQIYTESRQYPTRHESQYEVVWLPVIDPAIPWTDTKQKQFDSLQAAMPW
ncbi:protein SIEVE ELEMENT OCCLUSION B-like [Melia azedarach]|uniref:Protein SIEVE ELEMENT OCCLUSION B-like n=1 Tax=Melia azedarach TaxID=155640 RepID=A0ACC1Z1K5_MELAZ|nr:protein SIEVE ELEMENT OCCLUSION B-like [Melia azedarach]